MVDVSPYGSWPSPVTATWASTASARIDGAALVGEDVWWAQSLPEEAGRTAVLRRDADGTVHTVLPAPWNARSGVHEYGGGSWAVDGESRLFFVERSDQQVWVLAPGEAPRRLTDDADVRYGGLRLSAGMLLGIRERAGRDRAVVRIDGNGAGASDLVAGSDFVAQPVLSPRGDRLAWIAWNHPDMPWDRTVLRVGRIEGGTVSEWTDVTDGHSSALQPEWVSDEELVFLDDTTGRWNPWRVRLDDDASRTPIAPADADTGGPLWSLGSRWFGVRADGGLIAVRTQGSDQLVAVDAAGAVTDIDIPATSSLMIEATVGHRALVSGMAPGLSGIWLIELGDAAGGPGSPEVSLVVGETSDLPGERLAEWMPPTRPLTVDGPTGAVHAFVHPPTHPRTVGPTDERPPYLVLVHGGPTGHEGGVADSKTLFFTSRGIGVLEVNYGGSTGYGRAYRDRLRGQWGVVDVADVAAAASGLAAGGDADPKRLAIKGGSAGGWTVLAALARTDVFAAGISRYGVGDARALAADTHDFESRYLDGLIGPLPAAEDVYIERSPLTHIDGLRVPVLLLQGSDDAVVPPAQAEAIRDALAAHGIPHAYVLYEGEGHGFRRAESVVHALESELAFLGQVFGFDTPGVPPIALD